jgi:hypothetical protein
VGERTASRAVRESGDGMAEEEGKIKKEYSQSQEFFPAASTVPHQRIGAAGL